VRQSVCAYVRPLAGALRRICETRGNCVRVTRDRALSPSLSSATTLGAGVPSNSRSFHAPSADLTSDAPYRGNVEFRSNGSAISSWGHWLR
jgi:hypothetical protein